MPLSGWAARSPPDRHPAPTSTWPASPHASVPGCDAASCPATMPKQSAAADRTTASLSRSQRAIRANSLGSSGACSMAAALKQAVGTQHSAASRRL